jgi:hypothetical protein
MEIDTSFESVVLTQRANFLRDLSNASQATEQKSQSVAANTLSDTAQSFLSLNTAASFGADSLRGQNLDIKV